MAEFSLGVMVELSTGCRQSLLVATGVHGEAAVTAAPVVAVGGEADGIFGKEKKYIQSPHSYHLVSLC